MSYEIATTSNPRSPEKLPTTDRFFPSLLYHGRIVPQAEVIRQYAF